MEALLLALSLAASLGSPAFGPDQYTPVAVTDKTCPVMLATARVVEVGDTGLLIAYVVRNPHAKSAEGMIVTAAAVDPDGNVRSLQMRPVAKPIRSRTTAEYMAYFDRIELKTGERLVVGVQGVMWDSKHTWHGALPIARTTVSADPDPAPAAISQARIPR